MRHVMVMTATGSIGLMAIFVVDFLNLFYIAMLGQQQLAAAIGYAGTVLFFTISICIGVTIAGTALVSRALGARQREEARRIATSSLMFMIAVAVAISLVTLPLISPILTLFGARGPTHDIASAFSPDRHARNTAAGPRHGVLRHSARGGRCQALDVCDALGRAAHRGVRSLVHLRLRARRRRRRDRLGALAHRARLGRHFMDASARTICSPDRTAAPHSPMRAR